MVGVLWLVVLMTLASVHSESAPEQQCQAKTIPTIKLSVESHRNGTGFWISQVDIENVGDANISSGNKKTSLLAVGLEQKAVACNGKTSMLHSKITLALSDNAVPIPADYELFPGMGFYKFHPDAAIWARARQVCAEEGAHLIVINSEYEANVVKQLFTRFPKEKITNYHTTLHAWTWVGVYEQGANGQYFTVLGDTLNVTGYSRWYPGQPSDLGTDECMLAYSQSAGYNDHPCAYRAPFICEL